jgi:hypothetical protein
MRLGSVCRHLKIAGRVIISQFFHVTSTNPESFNTSMSWGTGSNLTSFLGNSLPSNSLYAPGFYLGEVYLQQSFLEGKFKLAEGRLSAGNSFAALPMFAN